MSSKICLAIVLALLVVAPAAISADEVNDGKEEADHFILYRVAGRKWTIRRIPKEGTEGGNHGNSYLVHEVSAVWDNRAEFTQTLLDAGRKDTGNVSVIKVEFDKDSILFRDPVGFKKIKPEKLKVQAGTFDCIRWQNDIDGGATLWTSVDFPSLIVKTDDRFGTRELTEFQFIEGDPGYKAPEKRKKRHRKANEDAEDEQTRLFGTRGRRWVHKTTVLRGPLKLKSYEATQYEITKADSKGCTLEITPLTADLQKAKGAESEKIEIDFETHLNDWLEPRRRAKVDRTEKRITAFGLMECTVYTFQDDEKRECTSWYAKEWPGLIVKKTVTGKDYEATTELVEFED